MPDSEPSSESQSQPLENDGEGTQSGSGEDPNIPTTETENPPGSASQPEDNAPQTNSGFVPIPVSNLEDDRAPAPRSPNSIAKIIDSGEPEPETETKEKNEGKKGWFSFIPKIFSFPSMSEPSGPPIYPRGLCGLSNLGNTCFMNSALQCLSHTNILTSYFLSGKHISEINKHNPIGSGGKLALTYHDTLKQMWSGRYRSISPSKLKSVIGTIQNRFRGFAQHDSQEFLAYLLDGLHEDLNRVKSKPYVEMKDDDVTTPDNILAKRFWDSHLRRNDSIIVDAFQGQLKSTVVCPTCNKTAVTFDPYMYLSLPLLNTAHKFLNICVFLLENKENPLVYTVKSPKNGTVADVKFGMAALTDIDHTKMILCRVSNCIITDILDDKISVSDFRNPGEFFYLFESIPLFIPNPKYIPPTPKKSDTPSSSENETENAETDPSESSSTSATESTTATETSTSSETTQPVSDDTQKSDTQTESNPNPGSDIATPAEPELVRNIKVPLKFVHRKFMRDHISTAPHATKPMLFTSPFLLEFSVHNFSIDFLFSRTYSYVKRFISEPLHRMCVLKTRKRKLLAKLRKEQQQLEPQPNPPVADPKDPAPKDPVPKDPAPEPKGTDDVPKTEQETTSTTSTQTAAPIPILVDPTLPPDEEILPPEENVDDEVPGSSDMPFRLAIVSTMGGCLHCGRCDVYQKNCQGCYLDDFSTSNPLRLTSGDTIAVDWKMSYWDQIANTRMDKASNHESYNINRKRIRHPTSLFDCLNFFTQKEQLSDSDQWYCSSCEEHKSATKHFEIWRVPDVLIFHLKRFRYLSRYKQKIGQEISFPLEELDMTPFINDETQKSLKPRYRLMAVSHHSGGASFGHYYAYAQTSQGWYLFNDSSVSKCSDVRKITTGGAYILFYERIRESEETQRESNGDSSANKNKQSESPSASGD